MKKEFINPVDLPDWSDIFSQVVVVQAGGLNTIYVSGQVAVDPDRNLVGRGDLETQAVKALENLQVALASAGAILPDVVKVTLYIKDFRPEQAAAIRSAYGRFFGKQNLPACNWIGVQSLANEDFLIEIDAVAVVADGDNPWV